MTTLDDNTNQLLSLIKAGRYEDIQEMHDVLCADIVYLPFVGEVLNVKIADKWEHDDDGFWGGTTFKWTSELLVSNAHQIVYLIRSQIADDEPQLEAIIELRLIGATKGNEWTICVDGTPNRLEQPKNEKQSRRDHVFNADIATFERTISYELMMRNGSLTPDVDPDPYDIYYASGHLC